MISRLLTSVATVVLLGAATVSAQTQMPNQGAGSAPQGTMQQAPGGAPGTAPGGTKPGAAGAESATPGTAPATRKPPTQQTEQAPHGKPGKHPAQAQDTKTEQHKSGEAAGATKQRPAETTNRDGQTGSATKSTDKAQQKSQAKEQNAKAGSRDTKITTQERREIKNTIVKSGVEPVRDVNVNISVGVAVPHSVVLHPLPPSIITIVPAYASYQYFMLADGRIIIVDPVTYEIVYVIT